MNSKIVLAGLLTMLAAAALTTSAADEPPDYKEYVPVSERQTLFEILADEHTLEIVVPTDQRELSETYRLSDLDTRDQSVEFDGEVVFDEDGLRFGDIRHAYDDVTDIRISEHDRRPIITFQTRTGDSRRITRVRRGNLIEPWQNLVVDDDDFIRGFVLSVTGDIEIYGEVNKDVLSLFGDVFIGPDAVVRGDIVSLTGRVDVAGDASVYGEVYSGKEGRTGRWHRFRRRGSEFSIDGHAYYNRVDGLMAGNKIRYRDADSLLPTVWAEAGYAFESSRWRFELGLEQVVLHSPVLGVGGSFYRRLASADDWLLSERENTVFAVVACEDFKDYYEAEGGTAWISLRPLEDLSFKGSYTYEETRWFDAQPNLWRIFGGDKKFRDNFSSVDSELREAGRMAIDSNDNAYVLLKLDYDTRNIDEPFDRSSWAATGILEWSHPDMSSGYDYRRYTLNVRRYQKFHRRIMLIVRGVFGGSEGDLPMQKLFYLGGLGTLHGYRHKEFMGSRFWMLNSEYRIDFPRSDLAASLSWDVGQVSADSHFGIEDEVRHSLGASLYFGNDLKLTVARRLDGAKDDDPKFYVRLAHVFRPRLTFSN
jgi:hypothetical protein